MIKLTIKALKRFASNFVSTLLNFNQRHPIISGLLLAYYTIAIIFTSKKLFIVICAVGAYSALAYIYKHFDSEEDVTTNEAVLKGLGMCPDVINNIKKGNMRRNHETTANKVFSDKHVEDLNSMIDELTETQFNLYKKGATNG